ncbi:MAG: protein translocase subunit SecD [Blastocatellia bacterium]|nr:protein translocase subunit SecD [Blastocatellia bacterium]
MRKNLYQRAVVIFVVSLLSLILIVFPRTVDEQGRKRTAGQMLKDFTSWSAIKENMASHIKLGLDLKGGSHLVMQVQVDDVIKQMTDNGVRQLDDSLKKASIPVKAVTTPSNGEIKIELSDPSKTDDARAKAQNDLGPEWSVGQASGGVVTFRMENAAADQRRSQAVEQAMEIIENRVNAFGVAEPTIQRHGPDKAYQILLQLPGIDNPERVKETVKAESKLELKAVIGEGIPYPTREAAQAAAGPAGEVLPVSPSKQDASAAGTGFMVVERTPIITGLDMRDATAVPARYGTEEYEIHFTLNPAGAQRFESWTSANIGKYLGIVLNGQVKSWPTIRDRISDRGQITGDFSKESAEDLALILRSGALPAKVIYLEERTVGPSLGADSIKQGVVASAVGLLLVMLFMVFYYRLSGINAIIALMLNLLLLVASLALFKATLTLPGIAGIILLIGMAVDSNVLIFERVREELRTGKMVVSAVDAGFNKAFLTIIDTHVTTIVSAFFLFIFGTGPIRGFAVTLIAGLIANLFTAVYVSKTMFGYWLGRGGSKPENLSI